MDMLFERIISSTLDELLTKVVRFSKQDFVLSMPDHSQRLRDLRSEVHENFAKPWTIGQMANMMGLSASRFASLYKQEFDASPTEDLIRTRIAQGAKDAIRHESQCKASLIGMRIRERSLLPPSLQKKA